MEMIKIDIIDIINSIPSILQYFVSGFIFVIIFQFLISRKFKNSTITISSCIISFTWVSLINLLDYLFNKPIFSNLWFISLFSILLSIVTSILFSKLFLSKKFNKFLVRNYSVTQHESVWNNIIDYQNGTNIKVYLKNQPYYYIGHLYSHEENGLDSWFSISAPMKYKEIDCGDDILIFDQQGNTDAYLVFNLKDIEIIQLFN